MKDVVVVRGPTGSGFKLVLDDVNPQGPSAMQLVLMSDGNRGPGPEFVVASFPCMYEPVENELLMIIRNARAMLALLRETNDE